MLRSDAILKAREDGQLGIVPWDVSRLGPNSYDVALGPRLVRYPKDVVMDVSSGPPPGSGVEVVMPEDGILLDPGVLYLGSTVERTWCAPPWIPMIEGRSSVGRLGVLIHVSAGFGDCGFDGNWTLEIVCTNPTFVRPGDVIAQVYFVRGEGEGGLYSGRYAGKEGPTPSRGAARAFKEGP